MWDYSLFTILQKGKGMRVKEKAYQYNNQYEKNQSDLKIKFMQDY
jgi:hypothetical protein